MKDPEVIHHGARIMYHSAIIILLSIAGLLFMQCST